MATLNKSLSETVQELTAKNDQLTKENRALYQDIENFKRETIALKGTALTQVCFPNYYFLFLCFF
jgi:cell division protein FtsB